MYFILLIIISISLLLSVFGTSLVLANRNSINWKIILTLICIILIFALSLGYFIWLRQNHPQFLFALKSVLYNYLKA
ncbi:hypothetical protein BSQ39_10495 [Loigolactobacillus backii]|nr:hypothetical protein BSQ39_10495 [Loigolactobacillus backii]